MSARSATTRPGWPPRRMLTTPVRATPVLTSRPRVRRCSATRADVRCSWLPSSGWAWMSCRQAITLASCALACCATSCLRPVGSVARAIGLPHARASAIKRLRNLDGVMLAPLGPWQSSRGSVSSGRKTAPGFLSRTGEINSLGRVDGFDDDEAQSECDEGSEVLVRFLAAERNALEALELADEVFDTGAGSIECLREERWPVLGR